MGDELIYARTRLYPFFPHNGTPKLHIVQKKEQLRNLAAIFTLLISHPTAISRNNSTIDKFRIC